MHVSEGRYYSRNIVGGGEFSRPRNLRKKALFYSQELENRKKKAKIRKLGHRRQRKMSTLKGVNELLFCLKRNWFRHDLCTTALSHEIF